MSSIQVSIKHQGKKYDLEVDTSAPGEVLKFQIYSVTGVEPERQKVIVKGGQLKDDTDVAKLGLKNGQVIMVMGTPAGTGDLVRPKEKTKFVEDMTEAEVAQQEFATPAGLINLGNTCYLNSTLQALRSIPELRDALERDSPAPASSALASLVRMGTGSITKELSALYGEMSRTQGSLSPAGFLNSLRRIYPQFAERSRTSGGFAQQDAEEAWSQILSQMRQSLTIKKEGDDVGVPFVDQYLTGKFSTVMECDDPAAVEAGEAPVVSTETFLKLNCFITSQTNHLRDGIANALKEKMEKKSSVLDREATYTKTSKITRLPKYLTVHFVRFFWRRDTNKKAKIMRKVSFPKELDVVEFCSDDLKSMLVPVRDKLREIRKDEEDVERARKRRKRIHAGTEDVRDESEKTKDKGKSNDGDTEMTETFKTDAEFEADRDASLLKAKKELFSLINPELLQDEGGNQSGIYELRAVVTHQGSSADSGHYTAYVKKSAPVDPKTGKAGEEDGKWWWFNDDKVSEVEDEKINTLSGGGESHSALILLYRAVPLPKEDGITE